MTLHLLVPTVLVLSVVVTCSCEKVYIIPDNSVEDCEVEPCYTVNQLANKIKNQSLNDLTLYFLPGKHFLDKQLEINSIKFVKMIGYSMESEIWLPYYQRTLSGKLLNISNTQELIIQNLTFVSSYIDRPGVIEITGSVTVLLVKCIFWQSRIHVHIHSYNITMSQCTVNNTKAPVGNTRSIVDMEADYIYIDKCQIVDNDSNLNTLTIYFKELLYINQSTFSDNYGGSQGALKILSKGGLSYITNCKFISNRHLSQCNAGAIQIILDTNATIVDTIFINNTAAIFSLQNAYLEIVNCTFADNHTSNKRSGTAITTVTAKKLTNITMIIIRGTTFSGNFGVSTLSIVRGKVLIENSNFSQNCADNADGVLIMKKSSLTLRQVVFIQNNGSIYLFNSRLDITGSVTLRGNVGGAINAVLSKVFINSMEEIVISNNTASSGGGILLRDSDLVVQSPIVILENTAFRFGGGIYAYLK